MIGFPFDSHVTFDEDGIPTYDRAISSAPYRAILKNIFSTGVLALDDCFAVFADDTTMNITISSGFAMIEGLMKLEENSTMLTIPPADLNLDRIDSIVIRLDDNDAVRACDLFVIKGEAGNEPVRPELTRSGSIYEIAIADIYVRANTTSISQLDITDTRNNAYRCGYIDSVNAMVPIADAVKLHMSNETIHITENERNKWNSPPPTVDYDGVLDGTLSKITVSSTDITVGSALETGKLFVVYEE